MAERWPQQVWINDGHRVEVYSPDLGDGAEVGLSFLHPRECPLAGEPGGWATMHACPLDWELVNVGLAHPGDGRDPRWREHNYDEEIPDEAWLAWFRARRGGDWPIEYWYESFWTPDTWLGPSEYEWSFMWRPVELGRLACRA